MQKTLDEEEKLVQAGFEDVRYDEKEDSRSAENESEQKKPRFDQKHLRFEVVSRPVWP
jgi:hypothetical protein